MKTKNEIRSAASKKAWRSRKKGQLARFIVSGQANATPRLPIPPKTANRRPGAFVGNLGHIAKKPPKPCDVCYGTPGRYPIHNRFGTEICTIQCPECVGTGLEYVEEENTNA